MLAQCTPAERDRSSSYCPVQLDPARSMLGAEQRDWLFEGLAARRRAAGTCSPTRSASRRRTTAGARTGALRRSTAGTATSPTASACSTSSRRARSRNVVVITGDKHQNSVRNVAESYTDLAGPPIATEFVGTSISSERQRRPGRSYRGGPAQPAHPVRELPPGYVRVDARPRRRGGATSASWRRCESADGQAAGSTLRRSSRTASPRSSGPRRAGLTRGIRPRRPGSRVRRDAPHSRRTLPRHPPRPGRWSRPHAPSPKPSS